MFGRRNKQQGPMQDKDESVGAQAPNPSFKESIDTGDDLPEWTAPSEESGGEAAGAAVPSPSRPATPQVSQPLTSNTAPNNPIAGITAPSRGAQNAGSPRPAVPSAASPSPAPAAPVPSEPRRAAPRASMEGADGKQLIVGRGIRLSGEITACEKLVVEGTVEADLTDCDTLEIADTGLFKGKAKVKNAEVYGTVDGELEVSGLLILNGSGTLLGQVRYKDIEVKRGGKMKCRIEDISLDAPAEAADSGPGDGG